MNDIINIIKRLFGRREFRFLVVGVINTIVGYGAYALFLSLHVNYLVASTLSTIIGVANSYIWNRFFTFKSKGKAFSELARFSLVYIVSYCISMLFLYLVVGVFGLNAYIAGGANIILTTLISWFGHNKFSFKEKGVK